jgi:hypothetical protein
MPVKMPRNKAIVRKKKPELPPVTPFLLWKMQPEVQQVVAAMDDVTDAATLRHRVQNAGHRLINLEETIKLKNDQLCAFIDAVDTLLKGSSIARDLDELRQDYNNLQARVEELESNRD